MSTKGSVVFAKHCAHRRSNRTSRKNKGGGKKTAIEEKGRILCGQSVSVHGALSTSPPASVNQMHQAHDLSGWNRNPQSPECNHSGIQQPECNVPSTSRQHGPAAESSVRVGVGGTTDLMFDNGYINPVALACDLEDEVSSSRQLSESASLPLPTRSTMYD